MSETQTQIFLDFPEEFQQLLVENGISIDEILRLQNVPAEVVYGVMPDELEDDARSKDPVMIILASSAVVLTVGAAISQVFHTLQRRPQLVEYYELVELKDAKGNILLDKKKKVQFKRVKKYDLIEPRKEDSNRFLEINFNFTNGLIIKFGSTENQMGTKDKPSLA